MKPTKQAAPAKIPFARSNPGTGTVAMVTPSVVIPQGEGAVLVKPGRPIARMTVKEFAQMAGFQSLTSVYDRIGTDEIPEKFIHRVGSRKVLIEAGAVEHFQAYWKSRRDGGIVAGGRKR